MARVFWWAIIVLAVLSLFVGHRQVSICRTCGVKRETTWWSFPGRNGLAMRPTAGERETAMSRLYVRVIGAPHGHAWKSAWHNGSGLMAGFAGHSVAPLTFVQRDAAALERVRPERAAIVLRAIDMDSYDGGDPVAAALNDLERVTDPAGEDTWWRKHRASLAHRP